MSDLFRMNVSGGLELYFNSREKAAEYFERIASAIAANPDQEIANMRQLAAALRGRK